MIRAVQGGDGFSLPLDREAAVKLAGWWAAYGPDCPFVHFWHTEQGGLFACMGDTALAAVPPADYEEAALFLRMQPTVRVVRSDPGFMRVLTAVRPGQTEAGQVMRLLTPAEKETADAPSPREAYPLLQAVFGDRLPPFEDWYVDVSHRLRHGCCRTMGVYEAGELAAVAMTTAECPQAALIGGVATRPKSRGRGYAHRCVMALAAALQQEDKAVWLSPKNVRAQTLYTRWGFVPAGEWANLTWKDDNE